MIVRTNGWSVRYGFLRALDGKAGHQRLVELEVGRSCMLEARSKKEKTQQHKRNTFDFFVQGFL